MHHLQKSLSHPESRLVPVSAPPPHCLPSAWRVSVPAAPSLPLTPPSHGVFLFTIPPLPPLPGPSPRANQAPAACQKSYVISRPPPAFCPLPRACLSPPSVPGRVLLNTNKHTKHTNKPSEKVTSYLPGHKITLPPTLFQLHTNVIKMFLCLNLCSSSWLACAHPHHHGYGALGDQVLPPPFQPNILLLAHRASWAGLAQTLSLLRMAQLCPFSCVLLAGCAWMAPPLTLPDCCCLTSPRKPSLTALCFSVLPATPFGGLSQRLEHISLPHQMEFLRERSRSAHFCILKPSPLRSSTPVC